MRAVLDMLGDKARDMTARGENIITAGAPGERPLASEYVGRFNVRRMPDDPACVRVSLGTLRGVPDGEEDSYCVIRGRPLEAIALLEGALRALRSAQMYRDPSA
jgi:hypothetical protein